MEPRPNVQHRDRLVSRISVMGQLSALVAMTSTGVIAGAMAHSAQVKDRQAVAARQQVQQGAPQPAAVRLVPRPIRTVLVRVPAVASRRVVAQAPVRATAVRRATTRPVLRTTTPARVSQPAPKPASQPAATTSSGS